MAENENGPVLGYSPHSGVKLLDIDGYKFKDLNKNGMLDKDEDWRLPADDRAEDLAAPMSVEQIAGLMLYSRYQALPSKPVGFGFAEGLQTMRTLARNMAWLVKCIEAGRASGICFPVHESHTMTNFIR